MNIYLIALFLHIVGALGISVALGLEWTSLRQIRNAISPEQVRAWMGILKSTNKVGFISMLTTVITGFYMLLIVWGWVAWILVTIGALVLMIAISRVVTVPRLKALGQARGTVLDPLLWVSIQTRVAIVLGIIFLKIAKPDLGGSLLTIGVAIIIGIATTLPKARREHAQELSAD
jgi:hypothetical protein